MRRRTVLAVGLFSLAALLVTVTAYADNFGSGQHTFEIDFVTIGNPGNPPDTYGNPIPAGSVPYEIRMGKHEISERMIRESNQLSGLGILVEFRGNDKAATAVSWVEAAKFTNWLNTSTGNPAAYKFDNGGNFQSWQPGDIGYDPNNLFRNTGAKYFIPTENEWYKAAYYDPNKPGGAGYWAYPTGSDTQPTPTSGGTEPGTAVFNGRAIADIYLAGGLSPLGTMAQGGNVNEWTETEFGAGRATRGGLWALNATLLTSSHRDSNSIENDNLLGGFRVASVAGVVPEPSSLLLAAMCCVGVCCHRRRS